MKNRTSSHFLILLLITFLTGIAHYAIYYGALIRGYETSTLAAERNLGLLLILTLLPIVFSRFTKYQGNWTLYTTAVLLFSVGLTVQYRLFSDDEYISKETQSRCAAGENRNASASLHSRKIIRRTKSR